MEHLYGFFSEDGTEFTITNPETPRAFDNFLWNDAVFSNVQQTGTGYCDYQVGDNEAVQLLTGVGRICDFDVFGRDHLMSRLVYIRDNETGEFWNVNWEPVCRPYDTYSCTHGLGYTVIKSSVQEINSEFQIFIPVGHDPVELWTLKTTNISKNARNITIFVYNQLQFKYKWGFDSYGDMIFRGSDFNKDLNAVVAKKHPHKKPHNYLIGFLTSDRPVNGFDGSREAFVGTYGSLNRPKAVVNGRCSNTPGSSDATIAAVHFNLQLQPGEESVISLILGATDSEEGISNLRNKYFNSFDYYFNDLKKTKTDMVSHNRVKTPDKHFDRMLNAWIKQGTLYGATWCRWGWNGYRDIVQHGFGVSSFEPKRTRAILLEALKYQYQSGLAIRGWNPVDEKPYSDSALWLVFTLVAYLKETGDMVFLDEKVPFYDGGSATVKEHIERALNFLETNKGAHNLCLIKFGDWNDSLTAVGKDGRGESVWLSEAYCEALTQMAALSHYLKDDTEEKDYQKRCENMKQAINKAAWNGNWYVRCFDDNGNTIGSHENKQGKIFLEAQTWSLIAGIADEEKTRELLKSCDSMLSTELGYMLLNPSFTERDDNIGRISCLEPGVCENGTIYSHVNAWMILGLIRSNMPDRAYELLKRITPGYLTSEADPKQKCPPYMFSNCYYGPAHKNNRLQMEFTWITGSLSWYINILLGDMLGIKPAFDGLTINPCIPSEWEGYCVSRNYRGCLYEIEVQNLKRGSNVRTVSIIVDGRPIEGNKLPYDPAVKHCKVDVILK